MNAITADDIAALKADGDLRQFIADLTANRPTSQVAAPPAIGSAHTAGHRPGAWPAGTRPAGPNTCSPDCTCSLAPTRHLRVFPPAA